MGEQDRIDRLVRLFGAGTHAGTEDRVAIGDDAAVLADGVVLSIDAMVEGRHFRRGWLSAEELGARATVAALSDLAAMGAEARAVLAHVTLPDVEESWLEELGRGQRRAAEAVGARVVGGNLSGGEAITIVTTVVGHAETPLRRDGGAVGDRLWAIGPLGHARAGLQALLAGREDMEDAVAAWRAPVAQVAAGRAVLGRARAAIDLSDGLGLDAARLARASGCGFALDEGIVDDEVRRWARALAVDATELVVTGGEDYALLVAAAPNVDLGDVGRRVGELVAGGAWRMRGGRRERLEVSGFDHFVAHHEPAR